MLTRNTDYKLKESRFKPDIRKTFSVKVRRIWNKLLSEALDAPSLDVFRVWLERDLSNLI